MERQDSELMDTRDVEELLEQVAGGTLSAPEAARQLARLPFRDLGFARVDHHRSLRQGIPEAIYCPGKSVAEVDALVAEHLESGTGPVICSRADDAQAVAAVEAGRRSGHEAMVSRSPGGSTVVQRPARDLGRRVLVLTAGTADGPIADECIAVLTALGLAPTVLRDRGVAGLHRLLGDVDALLASEATVVVAGMEGALASVVGGIARGPVVAVPTSVGYGSSLEGVTALLAMMSSCAAGVAVVGIDNGFGAALAIARALDVER
jgi:NCAIR mutase (PurE)-related protein